MMVLPRSGHGKFETLGALAISGVLLATAGGIAWHAFDVLLVYPCAIFHYSLHNYMFTLLRYNFVCLGNNFGCS